MTPAEIRALSPEDRTQLLRTLAADRYGEVTTLDLLAEEMGYSRRAVFDWVKLHTVPVPVLYALQAWADIATVAVTVRPPSASRAALRGAAASSSASQSASASPR